MVLVVSACPDLLEVTIDHIGRSFVGKNKVVRETAVVKGSSFSLDEGNELLDAVERHGMVVLEGVGLGLSLGDVELGEDGIDELIV